MSSGHEARREQKLEARPHEAAVESTTDLPPDVLANIVAETAAQLASSSPTDPALQAAMLDVARQFAGQPITVEPAGVALIAAVLQNQFPFLAERPTLLARAARTVAESLLSDPTACRRVEHLWATLSEEVA